MSGRKNILMGVAFGIAAISSVAFAVPLTVVDVDAPAINCVFNPSCKVTVTDTIGNLPPATGYTGTPRLQSRTYPGVHGAPAAGKTAYVYRVDFTSATARADVNCAVWLKLDFGPSVRLPYGPKGAMADVFVVTSGGLGTIGLAAADRVGKAVTFTFTAPVCPAQGAQPGQSSFFFGLAAATKPKASTAQAQLTFGGGIKNVHVRVPKH